MNGSEVCKAIANVFKFLDSLDLMPYIKEFEYKEIHDLMDKLEETFPYEDGYSKTLFDAIGDDEFVDYLNNKYNLNIREQEVINYYIRL